MNIVARTGTLYDGSACELKYFPPNESLGRSETEMAKECKGLHTFGTASREPIGVAYKRRIVRELDVKV